jgi:cardiolipin synthase C
MRHHLLWRTILAACLFGAATGCTSLPANTQRTASTSIPQPEATVLGQLADWRHTEAQARADSGFKLIDSVDLAYSSRLALIQSARRTLDIQSYAIHADASTETLLQAIRDAARRGVRVRILLDDFNSTGEDAQVLRLAFERNVEVRLFNPLPGPRNNLAGRVIGSLHDIPRIQKRMHNKLLVADSAWGLTGGRNIGDRFFGKGDKVNFVDLDVLATGRVVRAMSASFDHFWNADLAYPVQTLLSQHDLDKLRALPGGGDTADGSRLLPSPAAAPTHDPRTVLPTITAQEAEAARRPALDLRTVPLVWANSAFMVDEPGKIAPGDDEVNAGDTVIDGLLSLMKGAQRDVLIVSPYLVPGPRMMEVYGQLRQRGVRVRMLTNSMASNDAPAAHAGYLRYRKDLLAMGVELYEMRADPLAAQALSSRQPAGSRAAKSRASLHSKAVVIDGRLAIVGSMNLDLRSQIQNSEGALVIRSSTLSEQVARQVDRTLASAAYRLELEPGGQLAWRAPPGASFGDGRNEPGADARTRLMVGLLGPFAPDEML